LSNPYYRTAGWRALRAACLRRDPVCKTPGCGRASTHADHVVPRAEGGADALSNLRGLCGSCHNRRSASGNAAPRVVGCDEAGQNMRLRAWQKRIIRGIYVPIAHDGRRRVRTALITMGRKNGKTGLAACIALAHLVGPESEQRGQIYSAAADRDQAALIFREM